MASSSRVSNGAHERAVTVEVSGLQRLLELIEQRGYDVFGPVVRDGAIVVRPLDSVDQLPLGWTTVAAPGAVTLVRREDRARFGWALPAQSWKPLVHPSSTATMTIAARDGSVAVAVATRPPKPMAFFGVRPCELAALERLDTVLVDRPSSPDPTYVARRGDALLVVVNCGAPADTCFCTSMGTGPHVAGRTATHDLEITELLSTDDPSVEPRYLVRPVGTRGTDLVDALVGEDVAALDTDDDLREAAVVRDTAVAHIGRTLDAVGSHQALARSHDAEEWDEIAARCIACGNCTAVCPTCFCTRLDDVGDLSGTRVDRWRSWESCFSLEFSRLGSSSVRTSIASRYRQWMTHKLDTWHDQFGESGCVGCGRCIGWCPVGIDLVHEATRFVVGAQVRS